MRKSNIIVFCFLILLIVSCQKEIDWGLGGTANKLLVKISSKTGTDSTQVEYFYDASKRLIREKTTGVSGAQSLNNELKINRNSSGIITTTVQKADALTAAGIDSIAIRFNYNTTTSKYSSSVFNLPIPGFSVTDSAVYTYNASGKIISDAHYLSLGGLPIPLPAILGLKNNYTYSTSGSNLEKTDREAASTLGGPLSLVSSQAFTFDSKTNPLLILNEAVLLARSGLYNINNTSKTVVTNTLSPANNFTMDYIYKYNSSGKPDSSYATRTPGGAITASKYFYQ